MMSIIHEQDFKLYFGILKFINNLFHYVCLVYSEMIPQPGKLLK